MAIFGSCLHFSITNHSQFRARAYLGTDGSERRARRSGTEISLRTTARGQAEEDAFFVFTYGEGAPLAIGLGDSDYLLPRLQGLPGFDNEAFIRAMGTSEEGSWVRWQR